MLGRFHMLHKCPALYALVLHPSGGVLHQPVEKLGKLLLGQHPAVQHLVQYRSSNLKEGFLAISGELHTASSYSSSSRLHC